MAETKTNVVRLLESESVKHAVFAYDGEDGKIDGVSVARKVGRDPDQVFKTLVTVGKNTGPNVFVIPSNCELDLKKAAAAAGDKSVEMMKARDLEPRTGYVHGGCSPLGMKKQFPTFVEEMAEAFETILVSAGRIGLQIEIAPADLLRLTGGCYADLGV